MGVGHESHDASPGDQGREGTTMKTETIRETAQGALSSGFLAEVDTDGQTVWLTVRHENQTDDHCAGQNHVCSQMTRALNALGVATSRDYSHSGGFTCVSLTHLEIEAAQSED